MTDQKIESAFRGLSIDKDSNKLIIRVNFSPIYSGVAYLFIEIKKLEPIPIIE